MRGTRWLWIPGVALFLTLLGVADALHHHAWLGTVGEIMLGLGIGLFISLIPLARRLR